MIDTSDFKTGLTIELEGDPCKIVDFQHVKPGKGAAFVRTKIKNLKTGASIERTFRPGEKFQDAIMERKPMQYLYFDGESYVFMDNNTFDQEMLTETQMAGGEKFLKENMDCIVTYFKGEVMEVGLRPQLQPGHEPGAEKRRYPHDGHESRLGENRIF